MFTATALIATSLETVTFACSFKNRSHAQGFVKIVWDARRLKGETVPSPLGACVQQASAAD